MSNTYIWRLKVQLCYPNIRLKGVDLDLALNLYLKILSSIDVDTLINDLTFTKVDKKVSFCSDDDGGKKKNNLSFIYIIDLSNFR